MSETTVDPVLDEVEQLRQQIREAQQRIAYLLRFRSHPTVTPRLHYWRYRSERWEEAMVFEVDKRSALEQAYQWLAWQSDMGACSPEGIEVGGYEYSFDELEDRFGPVS